MKSIRTKRSLGLCMVVPLLFLWSCKKESNAGPVKVKPPVLSYVITARADKKGTNSSAEGTAVLKGQYDEGTKVLVYSIEYNDIEPQVITLRYGPKGTPGTFVRELYNKTKGRLTVIQGSFALTPLQERHLLKGFWSLVVSTTKVAPEISGVLTYKTIT